MKTNKEKITTTATYFFIKNGYNGASLSEISNAVGIQKGSLFNHIESKETLYRNVLKKMFDLFEFKNEKCSLQELIDFYIHRTELIINKINGMFNEEFDERITINDYMRFTLESSKRYPAFQKKILNRIKEDYTTWKICLQSAKELGEIRKDVDINLSASLFYFIYYGNYYLSAIKDEINVNQLKNDYYELYNAIKNN